MVYIEIANHVVIITNAHLDLLTTNRAHQDWYLTRIQIHVITWYMSQHALISKDNGGALDKY